MNPAFAALALLGTLVAGQTMDDSWLTWSSARAEGTGKAARVQGRVGGFFNLRGLVTDRSFNYKLAGTWMNPDVVRGAARMRQLTGRLTDTETRALVRVAEAAGDTVVMVEVDPREGSGVIPTDWSAFLQPVMPDGEAGRPIRGVDTPALREVPALLGVVKRNYDYDRFWVVFPLRHDDGMAVLPATATHAELVVRIFNKEGRVRWLIPTSVRTQMPGR